MIFWQSLNEIDFLPVGAVYDRALPRIDEIRAVIDRAYSETRPRLELVLPQSVTC
jgi:hypothetical protein